MQNFRVGGRVAAPVFESHPERKAVRSRYSYDIGTVVATGKHKKTGKPAVKVQFIASECIWIKRITKSPIFEKWFLAEDCDRI